MGLTEIITDIEQTARDERDERLRTARQKAEAFLVTRLDELNRHYLEERQKVEQELLRLKTRGLSRIELEAHRYAEQQKSTLLNMLLADFYQMLITRFTSTEEYRRWIAAQALACLEQLSSGPAVIQVRKADAPAFEGQAFQNAGCEIQPVLPGAGGFTVTSGLDFYDYTLETLFERRKPRLLGELYHLLKK